MKYVSEDHSLTVLVASIIASLFIAVLVGGCGNIVIGIISLIISCILFGISFLQLNKLLYAVYGSIFLLLSATSISNYRKDIHDPFALFKISVHYPRWIEAHQNMLTVFASIYMIVSILCVREAVSKMLLIWSCILSFWKLNTVKRFLLFLIEKQIRNSRLSMAKKCGGILRESKNYIFGTLN